LYQKTKVALHAIRLVKGYLTLMELKNLKTANFYSTLYYNSEIWHLPKLNPILKNHLLAASTTALKLCTPSYNKPCPIQHCTQLTTEQHPHKWCYISTLFFFTKHLTNNSHLKRWFNWILLKSFQANKLTLSVLTMPFLRLETTFKATDSQPSI
jgi:hypothetical protein